jgi:hypothetical protein
LFIFLAARVLQLDVSFNTAATTVVSFNTAVTVLISALRRNKLR